MSTNNNTFVSGDQNPNGPYGMSQLNALFNPPTSYSTPPTQSAPAGKTALENAISDDDINNTTLKRIPYMYTEQSIKAFRPARRLTIHAFAGLGDWVAHLDPNDVTRTEAKRTAALDTVTGVIIQDFGYKAEILEVKGSTGARYYKAIEEMDKRFNAQNLGAPQKLHITLESVDYQAIWTEFSFNRTINPQAGNIVQYSAKFIIFSRGAFDISTVDQMAATASTLAAQQSNNAAQTISGKDKVKQIQWSGSINEYIQSAVGPVNYSIALSYIQAHWDTSQGALPPPNQPLKPGQHLTVPSDWNDVATAPPGSALA